MIGRWLMTHFNRLVWAWQEEGWVGGCEKGEQEVGVKLCPHRLYACVQRCFSAMRLSHVNTQHEYL